MPSLLQTLMREPTRSYTNIYTDPTTRPPTPSYISSKSKNRPSSVRSNGSDRSSSSWGGYSTGATSASAAAAGRAAGEGVGSSAGGPPGAAWKDGQWQWSTYGGRGGLTGGAMSLHTPSVVERAIGPSARAPRASSLRSAMSGERTPAFREREEQGDGASVRSGRSYASGMSDGSARTSMSAPGGMGAEYVPSSTKRSKGKKKDKTASIRSSSSLREEYDYSNDGDYNYNPSVSAAVNARQRTKSLRSVESSTRYTSSSHLAKSASFLRGEPEPSQHSTRRDEPSRRYSSMSTAPSSVLSYPTSPNLSAISASYPKPRNKSPLRHFPTPADENSPQPSLTSSASSAPSSEPTTPIHPPLPTISPLSLDDGAIKPQKKKKSERLSLPQVVTAEPQAREKRFDSAVDPSSLLLAESPAPSFIDHSSPSSTSPTSPPVAAISAPHPPPLVRAESDNASFTTALGGIETPGIVAAPINFSNLDPAVPRLRLTRTDSDQARVGVRGSEELVEVTEPEEEETEGETSSEEDEEGEEDEGALGAVPASHLVEKSPESAQEVAPTPFRSYLRSDKSESTEAPLPSAAHDPSLRSPSLAHSTASSNDSSELSSTPISADVPDWLHRIRVLGEPIEPPSVAVVPSSSSSSPSKASSKTQQPLGPPAHLTVQQLRNHDSSGSSRNRSGDKVRRPRSVVSLRARATTMEVMPEESEAEAAAAAEEEGRSLTPAWVKRKDAPDVATRSPSPSTSSGAGSSTRRSRSVDLSPNDRDRLTPNSPLSRTSSLSASSARSFGSKSSYSDADIAAIAAAADAKPKRGLAKLLAPPLASSKAEKPPEIIAVRNPTLAQRNEMLYKEAKRAASSSSSRQPQQALPQRASSLRETASRSRPSSFKAFLRPSSLHDAPREVDEEDEATSDVESVGGQSQLSIMSAPQLSPGRPPRSPARVQQAVPSVPPLPTIVPLAFPTSPSLVSRPSSPSPPVTRSSSPPPPAHIPLPGSRPPSVAPPSREPSPSPSTQVSRSSPRPQSRSFSEVERPSMHSQEEVPPVPALPAFAAAASPTSAVVSSAPRPQLASYIAPASVPSSAPSSLALSPRIDLGKKKVSRRFGLFKRSSSADLASAASSSGKRFDAHNDLVFEPLDAQALKKRMRSDEVLVEVLAVGIDHFDRERVWAAAKGMGGAGFVPGRAVVGKVVETGEGVSRVKKGELVWGLNSVKKSASLASFVTLSRDHLTLAPSPAELNLPIDSLASLVSPAAIAMLLMASVTRDLPKGSKVLVLNAHTGVGHLCLQLARYLRPSTATVGGSDLFMVAQVSTSVHEGETVCRDAGATDVIRDEPLAAINGLHEGSFDVVVDTVGGRRLYDASRRILHHSGSFITTVGDSLTSTSPSTSSSNDGFRSLRRAFFKKDKKALSYWHVSPDADERESPREVLEKIREAVEAGGLTPLSSTKVLSFADAKSTFAAGAAEEGVVVHVKEV